MFYAIHAVRTRYPSKRSQVSTQIPSFMIEAASEAEALHKANYVMAGGGGVEDTIRGTLEVAVYAI